MKTAQSVSYSNDKRGYNKKYHDAHVLYTRALELSRCRVLLRRLLLCTSPSNAVTFGMLVFVDEDSWKRTQRSVSTTRVREEGLVWANHRQGCSLRRLMKVNGSEQAERRILLLVHGSEFVVLKIT